MENSIKTGLLRDMKSFEGRQQFEDLLNTLPNFLRVCCSNLVHIHQPPFLLSMCPGQTCIVLWYFSEPPHILLLTIIHLISSCFYSHLGLILKKFRCYTSTDLQQIEPFAINFSCTASIYTTYIHLQLQFAAQFPSHEVSYQLISEINKQHESWVHLCNSRHYS